MVYSAASDIAALAAWIAMVDGWQGRTASVIVARDAAVIWC